MTELVLLKALRTKLRAAVWPGGANLVFSEESVRITFAPTNAAFLNLTPPIALLRPLSAAADPDHGHEQDYMIGGVAVTLGVINTGDELGENATVGANRADVTKSEGAGLLEVQERLYNTIKLLQEEDGVVLLNRTRDAGEGLFDEETGYIATREYRFQAEFATE